MISCFKGKFRVTSPRGYRTDPITGAKGTYHKGIDLVGIDDITVYSISDGTVKRGVQPSGAGNYVVVTLDDGRRVYYMHLASFIAKDGARIRKGDKIGIMGSTGNSTGAHTHLELRPAGTTYDSLDICAFTGIPNKTGVYENKPVTPQEARALIQQKCGLEDKTMDYLEGYRFSGDLFLKLWSAMEQA